MTIHGIQLSDFRLYKIAKELGKEDEIIYKDKRYKCYIYAKFIYFLMGLTPYIVPLEDIDNQ